MCIRDRSVIDFFGRLADKIKGAGGYERFAKEVQSRFQKALYDAKVQDTDGISYRIDVELLNQFEDWLSGKMPQKGYFEIGQTPEKMCIRDREYNGYHPEKQVSSDDIKGIRLNQDNVLEITLDGTTWEATGSSGHLILDKDGSVMPQRARMQFTDSIVTDNGNVTLVQGVKGDKGEDVYKRQAQDITARNIYAQDITARNIDAWNIYAQSITARNVKVQKEGKMND